MLLYLQMIESPRERSKFEIVYRRYRSKMYRVAYAILGNQQDAEDAVHQAFVSIIENIEKISEPVCPKTASYVVTIVENTAINVYRRKKRHPAVALERAPGLSVDCTHYSELAQCMASLPTRQRQVLLLRHHHGYTVKEVAKMLGMTTHNVYKTEQRAKAKLEQLCKEAEIL